MIDLIGQKFGRLTVIKQMGKNRWRNIKWLCLCDCGDQSVVYSGNLRNNSTQSCGCLQKESITSRSTKHRHNKRGKETRTHRSWRHIIDRCTNPNNAHYQDYGGRGIKVCKEWLEFINFLKDMKESPGSGYSIDRTNNNKGYSRENCRWATSKEQQRNTRNNRMETYKRKTQCIAVWAEEYGIPYNTLWSRLYMYGWSMEKALTIPIKAGEINDQLRR